MFSNFKHIFKMNSNKKTLSENDVRGDFSRRPLTFNDCRNVTINYISINVSSTSVSAAST